MNVGGVFIHGMSGTRLNRIWKSIKQRCQYSKHKYYKYYGAKGITVFEEWQRFEPFMEWALCNGYNDNLEIDRIDNNGNYEPDNCRFVTKSQNCNNRRNNRPLEINGVTKNLSQWETEYGLKHGTIRNRIKDGWPTEKLLLPTRRWRKSFEDHFEVDKEKPRVEIEIQGV